MATVKFLTDFWTLCFFFHLRINSEVNRTIIIPLSEVRQGFKGPRYLSYEGSFFPGFITYTAHAILNRIQRAWRESRRLSYFPSGSKITAIYLRSSHELKVWPVI